jgi:hypothetical protein
MNLGPQIDEESIWMSFWRRHRTQVAIREDLVRRERNRRDEEVDDAHKRQVLAEQHVEDMKVIEARRQTETHQVLADRRTGQEALRAWQGGSDDRRER